MFRHPAFEREISRAPFADASMHLVYADWLAERGAPRGTLMTVQHTLSDRPSLFELENLEYEAT